MAEKCVLSKTKQYPQVPKQNKPAVSEGNGKTKNIV